MSDMASLSHIKKIIGAKVDWSWQDLRVGNKYRIGRKIGSGSFGDIYLGMDPRSDHRLDKY